MRFDKGKDYSVTIYDKDARIIWSSKSPLHFNSKKDVLESAKLQAEVFGAKLGHVSVCDNAESKIVRYTPSGRIWG